MTNTAEQGWQKVREMIQEIGVGMLTTIDGTGELVSRPMLALLLDDDPDVYFLTHANSAKVGQLAAQARVALTFVGQDKYLAVVGRARALQDAAMVTRLWNPTYRAWFPDGADGGDVTVLGVAIDRADYWEPPTSRVVRLIAAVAAVVTRNPYETPKTTVEGTHRINKSG